MTDQLGIRMKSQYENRTRYFLPRRTYTIIRLDGKSFHTFTKSFNKPFDKDFINVMDKTAKYLCNDIQGAKIAFVQSDEISLLLTDFEKDTTDAWFDGNIQKIASVSASITTAKFNREMQLLHLINNKSLHPEYDIFDKSTIAFFDARVFTIPDPVEVENYFIWRQKDAVRNSLAMHAQSLFSHKELNGKSQVDMHDMIHEKGENWNSLPDGFKRGRTIVKNVVFQDTDGEPISKTSWEITTPDFLKERETLTRLIPKYT